MRGISPQAGPPLQPMQAATGRTTPRTGARQIILTATTFIGRAIEILGPIPHGRTPLQEVDTNVRQQTRGTQKRTAQGVFTVIRQLRIGDGGGLATIPAISPITSSATWILE